MSELPFKFPLNHRVFAGGRYLSAFDSLPDIDHFEHSILTFLGSKMPFDKSFVDHPAWPSIPTIANATKISEATIRDRLKKLKVKGYINVQEKRCVNTRGKFEQLSNRYFLTVQPFEFFEDVLDSSQYIGEIRKEAVGQSFSFADRHPPTTPHEVGYYEAHSHPVHTLDPNSPLKVPTEDQIYPPYSSRTIFEMKSEADRVIRAWEELLKLPVSKNERERFLRDFIKTKSSELYHMERLLLISGSEYLSERAKSINFLFGAFDQAQRNEAEIKKSASNALRAVRNVDEFSELMGKIPDFVCNKSKNYAQGSDALIQTLLQGSIDETRKRLNMQSAPKLVSNTSELVREIEAIHNSNISDESRQKLTTVLELSKTAPFGTCLKLFERYHPRASEIEARHAKV